MSLESKITSLRYPNNLNSNGGRNPFKMGTIYKSFSSALDIEKKSAPVEGSSKSRINRTIPVEELPQEEPKTESDIIEEKKEPLGEIVKLNNSGSVDQIAYSKK